MMKKPLIWKTTMTKFGADDLIDKMAEQGYIYVSREDSWGEHRLGFEYVEDESKEIQQQAYILPKMTSKMLIPLVEYYLEKWKNKQRVNKYWLHLCKCLQANSNGDNYEFEMNDLANIAFILSIAKVDKFYKWDNNLEKIRLKTWNTLDKESKDWVIKNSK